MVGFRAHGEGELVGYTNSSSQKAGRLDPSMC